MADISIAMKQAKSLAQSIVHMVKALELDYSRLDELEAAEISEDLTEDEVLELAELRAIAGDCRDKEDARDAIVNDAYGVSFRSGWSSSPASFEPEEFRIELAGGGPAIRIIGKLDQYNEPVKLKLQCQDWFTPWVDVELTEEEEEALEKYCQQFYFGQ